MIGGARMGGNPETSVVDADHRIWDVPNVLVVDGSVCPTQGAANPALTIMALASRLAEHMHTGGPCTALEQRQRIAGAHR